MCSFFCVFWKCKERVEEGKRGDEVIVLGKFEGPTDDV